MKLSSGDKTKISGAGGTHSLTVSNIAVVDGGQYTVRAANDFGESRCTATLLVQGWRKMSFLTPQINEEDFPISSRKRI